MHHHRVAPGVPFEHPLSTNQPQEDPQRGRLPGTVRAEEPVRLTLADPQVQTVQSAGSSEALDEPADDDDVIHERTIRVSVTG